MRGKIRPLRVRNRPIPLWIVGLGFVCTSLLIYFPYLKVDFSADDFMFINMIEGAMPYNPLYGFWHGELDSYPAFQSLWWVEPGVSGAFLRPLASWALTLLYWGFGRNAVPYHAALLVIHGLVAFTAFLILRRLSGRNEVALLASVLFLISDKHGMTVNWITTITDLLGAFLFNLAFLNHLIAREENKPWHFPLSLVFALTSAAAKETAVVYPLVVAAYEFFYAGPLADMEGSVPITRRLGLFIRSWWAWTVPLLLVVGYLVIYRELVPPMRNLMYVDPFGQPGLYLTRLLTNLPVMFVGLLTQFLPSLVTMLPMTQPYVVVFGSLLVVSLVWVLLPYRQERAVWFTLVLFVLGLLPGLATDPGERQLYYPSVFGLYPVAWLILRIPRLARVFAPGAQTGIRVLEPVWSWSLLFTALIIPVVLLFVYPFMWIPGFRLPEETILRSLPYINSDDPEYIIYLNTNSSYNTFYMHDIYCFHRGEYPDLHLLSSFNGRVWARLESDKSLLLRTKDPGWLNNMFARVVRLSPTIAVGDSYANPLFTATIERTSDDKQDVQEVRFDFTQPLDDPAFLLLTYDGENYQRWHPTSEWELLNSVLDPIGF